MYTIDILNTIAEGSYTYQIDALNAICIANGAAGGHVRDIDAYNALAVAVGAEGNHKYSVDAVNAMVVYLGGTGGEKYLYDALVQLASNLIHFTSALTFDAAENQTAVGTLTVNKQDAVFEILAGGDGAKFQIGASTGVITFKSAPDYENPQDTDTNNSYLINVRATSGSLVLERTITVNVTNVNGAPTDISLSASAINENNAIGDIIGTFTTTDPDVDTYTYTLVSGTGSTDNASFSIVGDALKAGAIFDYETKNSFSIRVRSTDSCGLYFEKVFAITINDIATPTAPTDLALTAVSDTSIDLAWTDNSNNEQTFKIERSTNGADYAEIASVSTGVVTYNDTGLTEDTRYYYRVRAYNGEYSLYCTAVYTYTYYAFTLTATGNGSGVSTLRFTTSENQTVKFTGTARFYSNSDGTTDESSTWSLTSGALRTIYLKCPSSTAKLLVKVRMITQWGDASNNGWVSTTNAPSIAGNVSKLAADINRINIGGSNTLSGSISGLTSLQYLLIYGSNTINGDIGGSGTAALVNGITSILLNTCAFVDYTSGATWSLTSNCTINPAVGYGYSSTEIDNMLIDMAASLGTVTSKTITLQGSSAARTAASNSAVTTLNGKGWTVVTN